MKDKKVIQLNPEIPAGELPKPKIEPFKLNELYIICMIDQWGNEQPLMMNLPNGAVIMGACPAKEEALDLCKQAEKLRIENIGSSMYVVKHLTTCTDVTEEFRTELGFISPKDKPTEDA